MFVKKCNFANKIVAADGAVRCWDICRRSDEKSRYKRLFWDCMFLLIKLWYNFLLFRYVQILLTNSAKLTSTLSVISTLRLHKLWYTSMSYWYHTRAKKQNHADAKDSCKSHPHTQSTSFFVMCSKCHIWDTTSLPGIIDVVLAAIYNVNFNLSELIHIALWWNSAICSWFMENCFNGSSWWRHQMERFSALLALCVGNSPVTSKGQWRGK